MQVSIRMITISEMNGVARRETSFLNPSDIIESDNRERTWFRM